MKARIIKTLAIVSAAALGLALITVALLHQPRPTGTEGTGAEAMTDRMLEAVGHESWEETGAVQWTFDGRHHHLWDRRRGLARVRYDDIVVLVNLTTREGVALDGDESVDGLEARGLVHAAWALWANDSFWLNPAVKARDPGTTRSVVTLDDGTTGLLVSYTQGGVTPGDAYLWLLDADGTPRAWRIWAAILPVGGVEFSFTHWETLSTGARVSTQHESWLPTLRLENVRGAKTLSELVPGPDPFAALDTL